MVFHGGNVKYFSKRFGLSKDEIIDFSANINPLGPPDKTKALIQSSFKDIDRYPDPVAEDLRESLGDVLGLPKGCIIAGNGAVELIYAIGRIRSPMNAIIPAPTFGEYEEVARISRGKVSHLALRQEEGFQLNVDALIRKAGGMDNTNLTIFVNNPNNPTGRTIQRGEIEELVKFCEKRRILLCLDEAFIEFSDGWNPKFLPNIVKRSSNLFVIRSLTKFFAIAGLRVGYGFGSKAIIKDLLRVLPPWNVNLFAQIVASNLIKDGEFIQRTGQFIKRERRFLFNGLKEIKGLRPYPSDSNFILVESEVLSSQELTLQLISRGILVRDCSTFRFFPKRLRQRFIRVAVRKRRENIALLNSLKEISKSLS
jgi:threonine-phosphate decarboxylase